MVVNFEWVKQIRRANQHALFVEYDKCTLFLDKFFNFHALWSGDTHKVITVSKSANIDS